MSVVIITARATCPDCCMPMTSLRWHKFKHVFGRLRYSLRHWKWMLLTPGHRPKYLAAWFRMLWHDFVLHPLFIGTEVCEDCGRYHFLLWFAPDELWELATGESAAETGLADGILCPQCFSDRLEEHGIIVRFVPTILRDKRTEAAARGAGK